VSFSIRSKFLLVMSGLLALVLGIYLLMSVAVFKSDKTQLVFDLNRSQVTNLTNELETQLGGVSEKLKLFAVLPTDLQRRYAEDLFSENSDVVAVSVFKAGQSEPVKAFTQSGFLKTYGLDEHFFAQVSDHVPVPVENIRRESEDLWNASHPSGPPLIGYGRLVVMQDERGLPVEQWAVVAYVKLDRLLKSLAAVRLTQVTVTNRRGEILLQNDAQTLVRRPTVDQDALFKEAITSEFRVGVTSRESNGSRHLIAYGKGFNSRILVIAMAPETLVFKVVQELTLRTLLFGSIVLTLVILAAFLISRSLTQNIALLARRMEGVRQGDLSTQIQLTGRDETRLLAETFNQMIRDLKESRDALEGMNRELDQKVKDRTVQLEEQNRKIKEVQEALIRTTRLASVGEIAGRTAHEVLNPLTILLTRTGLMLKRLRDNQQGQMGAEILRAWESDYTQGGFNNLIENWRTESQVDPGKNLFQEDLENLVKIRRSTDEQLKGLEADVQFIKNEGERIGKIVNSMRRLGNVRSEVKKQHVHEVLDDCCQIMADLFTQRNCMVETSYLAKADVCLVDRDELIQAVTNLMRNSLQALDDLQDQDPSPTDTLHMKVRTWNIGREMCIEIEDNGAGIMPEHQSKLFRSSFTTKSSDRGTGLGLGISRRFVRSYGGDIEFVTSKPKDKTVFRIRLPVAESLKEGEAA
jgi:signal transduction histidine kinase